MAGFETGFQAERDGDFSWISPLGVDSSLEQLLSYAEDEESAERILDAGCGDGTLTAALAERYPDRTVHGIDPIAEDVAQAEERVADLDNATVEQAYLDPEVHDADLVYAINMIQDTSDPAETIADVSATVGEGGTAILTAPITGTEDLFIDPAHRYDHVELTEYEDRLDIDWGHVRGEAHYGDDLVEQRLYAADEDGGESLVLSQYTIALDALERFCHEAGFEIVGTGSLPCSPSGVSYFMDFLGYTEEREAWRERTERWREDPDAMDDDDLPDVYTLILRK